MCLGRLTKEMFCQLELKSELGIHFTTSFKCLNNSLYMYEWISLSLSFLDQNRIVLIGKMARIKILKQNGITKENLDLDLTYETFMLYIV